VEVALRPVVERRQARRLRPSRLPPAAGAAYAGPARAGGARARGPRRPRARTPRGRDRPQGKQRRAHQRRPGGRPDDEAELPGEAADRHVAAGEPAVREIGRERPLHAVVEALGERVNHDPEHEQLHSCLLCEARGEHEQPRRCEERAHLRQRDHAPPAFLQPRGRDLEGHDDERVEEEERADRLRADSSLIGGEHRHEPVEQKQRREAGAGRDQAAREAAEPEPDNEVLALTAPLFDGLFALHRGHPGRET
jgi:hypothetical protein